MVDEEIEGRSAADCVCAEPGGGVIRMRKRGMGRPQLAESKALEKENKRLEAIVAELELDKLILRKGLDPLTPPAV